MKPYSNTDKKILAIIGILSSLLALGCLIVGLEATHYDSEAFADPLKLLDMPGISPDLIRRFMLLDMFGYYLLLLPFVFYVHCQLANKTPWAPLFTSLGFGYVITGAIGAAVLAVVWPSIIEKHSIASGALKEIYKADFLLATDFVVKAMWNYLEVLMGGVWWIAVGFFMKGHKTLKVATMVLGIACLLDSIGEIVRAPGLAEIGLNVYLILAIIWPVWIGLSISKNNFYLGTIE